MSHPTQHKPSHPHAAQPPHGRGGGGFGLLPALRHAATRQIALANAARYFGWALWAVGVGMLFDVTTSAPSAHSLPFAVGVVLCGLLTMLLAASSASFLQLERPRAAEARVRAGLLSALWSVPEYRPPNPASGGGRSGASDEGADVALLTQDVEKYTNNHDGFQGQVAGAVLGPIAVLALLAVAVDWLSALVLLLVLPLAPVTIGWFQRKFRAQAGASRRMRVTLAAQFTAIIRGMETIVLGRAGQRVHSMLAHAGERNRKATMALLARNQLVLFVSEAAFALATTAVSVLIAVARMQAGALTEGQAVALVLVSLVLTTPLQLVGSFFYIGMAGRAAGGAMGKFRARFTQRSGEQTPENVTIIVGPDNEVRLSNATIARQGRTLVQGLDLHAAPGRPVVLTGPSGAGKSSVIAALHGTLPLAAPNGNGGHSGNATSELVLPEAGSALIAQRTWLFTGSLRENLELAMPADEGGSAVTTDEALLSVLATVQLEDFAQERGLATPVGEDGTNVSAGQAQRISIARALLAGKQVLLCDEPTAHVDQATHHAIMDVLAELSATHAVVLVSHVPGATLPNATHIEIGQEQQ
ncbi:ATP-binding cassette domain-containing protein [Corynebacterium sp. 35RC1]|nr:ATP-binding cassette domain-containing protein [Corynebacterium sp. 35RC1]